MATCRSCGARIVWARSEKTGKPMPVDVDEVDDGNLVFVAMQEDGTPIARYVANGEGLRVSHFATCPDAKAHRK
jgi:hypothetical protein